MGQAILSPAFTHFPRPQRLTLSLESANTPSRAATVRGAPEAQVSPRVSQPVPSGPPQASLACDSLRWSQSNPEPSRDREGALLTPVSPQESHPVPSGDAGGRADL